jgi:hypothetical protein
VLILRKRPPIVKGHAHSLISKLLIVEKQPFVHLLGHPSNGAFQVIDAGTGTHRGKGINFQATSRKAGLRSCCHGHFVGTTTTSAKPFTVR